MGRGTRTGCRDGRGRKIGTSPSSARRTTRQRARGRCRASSCPLAMAEVAGANKQTVRARVSATSGGGKFAALGVGCGVSARARGKLERVMRCVSPPLAPRPPFRLRRSTARLSQRSYRTAPGSPPDGPSPSLQPTSPALPQPCCPIPALPGFLPLAILPRAHLISASTPSHWTDSLCIPVATGVA